MKKWTLSLLAAGLLTAPATQAQELPDASPRQKLEQDVGLTAFTVNYSRPGKKERAIFGGLVPFGEIWRTGANKATTISFDTPVIFQGEEIPAGRYSLFTKPGEETWTVIFNKDTDLWGTGDYDPEKDVARLEVKTQSVESTENLTIGFDKLRTQGAHFFIKWERTGVFIPLEVPTMRTAMRNIEKALAEAEEAKKWRVYRNAAGFYHNNELDPEKALDYMKQSLERNEESWYSHWLHAEILASMDSYDDAVNAARQAMEIGKTQAEEDDGSFPYAKRIEEGIRRWKEKS
jgi:hypothetical protein